MKTRIIGDIHGHWYDYHLLTSTIKHSSIQVGDFGIGFNGEYWEDRVNDHHQSGQHRFIRGNHDDPSKCKNSMVGYVPDGLIENNTMFVGGAWSIDHAWRTEGENWWRDEELSYKELHQIIDIYAVTRPEVMISHDCPTLAAYHMFVKSGKAMHKTLHLTRTGEAFQTMFELHQPKYWFFGHWHHTLQYDLNGTHFHCLGIDDFVDFDLETLEYV